MRSVEIKRKQFQMLSNAIAIAVMLFFSSYLGNATVLFLVVAIEIASFFSILISSQLSEVLGKLLRNRMNKHQYKNAGQIRRYVLLVQAVFGALGTALVLLLAGYLTGGVVQQDFAYYLTLILAPLVLLRTLTQVFLGFFQGEGNELPSVIIGVLRQLLIWVLGLQLGNGVRAYGIKVSELLKQEAYQYVYAGMGVALGIVLAELILVIVLAVLYLLTTRNTKRNREEGLNATESAFTVLRILFKNRWGAVVQTLLCWLPLWLGIIISNRYIAAESVTLQEFGVFYIEFLGLLGILAFIMLTAYLPLIGKAVQDRKNEGHRFASEALGRGMLYILANQAFLGVLLYIMREHIAKLISKSQSALLTEYMGQGVALLMLAVFVYFFMRILYMLGKRYMLLIVFGAADLVLAVVLLIVAAKGSFSIGFFINMLFGYTAVLCILLGFICCMIFRVGAEMVLPLASCVLAAGLAGVVQLLLSSVFTPHLGGLVTLLVVFVLTFIPYWLLLLVFRIFKDEDFAYLPGGRILLALGQMLHLY